MSVGNEKNEPTTIAQLVEAGHTKTSNSTNENNIETQKNNHVDTLRNNRKVKILDTLLEKNMLVPGSALDRTIWDDYRRVKRPLVSNASGRNKSLLERGNVILVTSSVPGEGKTYTSTNLALSISQEVDTTVLLIDGDVAKQGISRMLGLEKMSGMVDVLESNELSIGDVMLQTDVPNLTVVPAGMQNEYVAELLASKRMMALVNEMADRYSDRIIVIDGPPLLPTPQTQVLAGLVGQVVFVVEGGKTPQTLVEEALSLIPDEQATSMLLNKNEGLSRNGHYYGYYYGYYGDDES